MSVQRLCIIFILLIPALNAKEIKNLRDPFFISSKRAGSMSDVKNILLLGVVQSGKKIGALVEYGNMQKTVFKGDDLHGYIVESISLNQMVIVRGKKKISISMNVDQEDNK